MKQAEEIFGLGFGVELRVLVRAEAGRVELRWVSDADDVVEEADKVETDECLGLGGGGGGGGWGEVGADRNLRGDGPSKLTGLVCGADGDTAEFGHRANILSCRNQEEHV